MRGKIALAVSLLFFSTGTAWALPGAVQKGNDRYRQGDFAGAIEKYEQALKKDAESAIINFNLGTAYYKKGEWLRAAEHLQKALLGDDRGLQEKAHYNLGNAFYQSGAAQETKNNVDGAVAALEKSVGHYQEALQFDAKDQDAKANYDFVRQELERLKKIQQKQQQQKKDSKSSKNQDQQDQQSPSGQEQQQAQQDKDKQGNKGQDQQGQKPDSQPPDQQPQQASGGQQKDDQQNSQSGQQPSPGDQDQEQKGDGAQGPMTPDEAKGLLNDYQQNDEPKGIPNFLKGPAHEAPVQKDW